MKYFYVFFISVWLVGCKSTSNKPLPSAPLLNNDSYCKHYNSTGEPLIRLKSSDTYSPNTSSMMYVRELAVFQLAGQALFNSSKISKDQIKNKNIARDKFEKEHPLISDIKFSDIFDISADSHTHKNNTANIFIDVEISKTKDLLNTTYIIGTDNSEHLTFKLISKIKRAKVLDNPKEIKKVIENNIKLLEDISFNKWHSNKEKCGIERTNKYKNASTVNAFRGSICFTEFSHTIIKSNTGNIIVIENNLII